MKIGVLIATYNGIDFLQEQLDSILNQTKKVDEIVVSDDGSNDGTLDFLYDYKNEHTNVDIKIVQNKENHGVSNNFSNAFKNSSAEYLFFCDQDDVWKNDKVETFCKALEKYPDCGLYFSNAEVTYQDLKLKGFTLFDSFIPQIKPLFSVEGDIIVLDRDFIMQYEGTTNLFTGMSMLVSRDVLKKITPFSKNIKERFLHDEQIALYCALEDKICCINACTAFYRQHEKNVIGSTEKIQYDKYRKKIDDYIITKMYYVSLYYKVSELQLNFYSKINISSIEHIKNLYDFHKKRYEIISGLKLFSILKSISCISKYKKYLDMKTFVTDVLFVLLCGRKKRKKMLDVYSS